MNTDKIKEQISTTEWAVDRLMVLVNKLELTTLEKFVIDDKLESVTSSLQRLRKEVDATPAMKPK